MSAGTPVNNEMTTTVRAIDACFHFGNHGLAARNKATTPTAASIYTKGISDSVYLSHLPPINEYGTIQKRNMKIRNAEPGCRQRITATTRPIRKATTINSGTLIARNNR